MKWIIEYEGKYYRAVKHLDEAKTYDCCDRCARYREGDDICIPDEVFRCGYHKTYFERVDPLYVDLLKVKERTQCQKRKE